jgi:hypothetical protein
MLVLFRLMGSSCGARIKGCCCCRHRRAKTEVARLAANIIHLKCDWLHFTALDLINGGQRQGGLLLDLNTVIDE